MRGELEIFSKYQSVCIGRQPYKTTRTSLRGGALGIFSSSRGPLYKEEAIYNDYIIILYTNDISFGKMQVILKVIVN